MTVSGLCELAKDAVHSRGSVLELRCTVCGAYMGSLPPDKPTEAPIFHCSRCGFQMRNENGIWQALTPERLRHFSQFIDDYQTIRAAEGRGSLDADFYQRLPYQDVTGKNVWQWKIRARTFDLLIKRVLPRLLRNDKESGTILDLGAGNGWMSYRLSLARYTPVAVDLLTNDQDGLGAAVHFKKHLKSLFPRFRAEMSALPFADNQFDAVIFNASFHYAENYEASMHEALRCTKTHGAIIIADSPWYSADESGQQMVSERQAAFRQKYGTASDSIASLEYLTDERLERLEQVFHLQWQQDTPFYGLQWTMRPLWAKLRGKREPSRFRIYSARKPT